MIRKAKLLLCICAAVALSSGAAQAKRHALVIGNDTYRDLPASQQLKKARNDARAVAKTFEELGYTVTLDLDVSRFDMNRNIDKFANAIEPGDTAAVFFAGHGVRIKGRNYLLPSDVPNMSSGSEDLLAGESIPVDRISDRLKEAGARIAMLILDACRDNPFKDTKGRSVGGTRGLARVEPPEGTIVLFSAGANQQALDRLSDNDPDPNSIFTRSLIPLLKQDGLEIGRMARLLRRKVRSLARTVNYTQTPAVYNELTGDFYLRGGPGSTSAPVVAAKPKGGRKVAVEPVTRPETKPAPTPATGLSAANAWKLIETSKSPAVFEAFIKQYPDSFLAVVAKERLKALTPKKVAKRVEPKEPTPRPAVAPRRQETRSLILRKNLGVRSARELNGATVCLVAGSRSEASTKEFFRKNNMQFGPVTTNSFERSKALYRSGRCDVLVADSRSAQSIVNKFLRPGNHQILPERIAVDGKKVAVGTFPETARPTPAPTDSGRLTRSFNLKMATTFPRDFVLFGASANRFTREIGSRFDGRVNVQVFGAGERMGAFEVFDAVAGGKIEFGWAISYYWRQIEPAFDLLTRIPFGPDARTYSRWRHKASSRQLIDSITARHGVIAIACGATPAEGDFWSRKAVRRARDLRGMKIRAPGLQGDLLKRLGVTPIVIAGGEILTGFQTGVLDAVNWVTPQMDAMLGLHEAGAKNYYYPSSAEPGMVIDLLINKRTWDGFPAALQRGIAATCLANVETVYAEAEQADKRQLTKFRRAGVRINPLPGSVRKQLESAWNKEKRAISQRSASFRRLLEAAPK